jgi:hypothetical protein
VKCTQYGICSQTTSKNAKIMFFSQLGVVDNNFRSGSNFPWRAAPTPQVCVGVITARPWILTKFARILSDHWSQVVHIHRGKTLSEVTRAKSSTNLESVDLDELSRYYFVVVTYYVLSTISLTKLRKCGRCSTIEKSFNSNVIIS